MRFFDSGRLAPLAQNDRLTNCTGREFLRPVGNAALTFGAECVKIVMVGFISGDLIYLLYIQFGCVHSSIIYFKSFGTKTETILGHAGGCG